MRPFSDEWALAYRDAINASEGYRHSAANWELGPVALIARVDGDDQEDAALYLDLERGECRYAMILSPKDASEQPIMSTKPVAKTGGESSNFRSTR